LRVGAPIASAVARVATAGMLVAIALGPGARRASAAPLSVALDPGVIRGPVAVYDTTREGLAVAAPASFRAAVDGVAADARLLTALAVPPPPAGAASTGTAARLRFRIVFEGDGDDVTLYARDVDVGDPRDRRWIDVGVPLAAVAGRHGTLRFETTSAADRTAPAAAWWAPPEVLACDATAPSVVLVTIDALRADHLGSAGYARPTTPRLDAFAADATRFTAAFTGGPKTIPSIPQILTGRWLYWQRIAHGLPELLGEGGTSSRAIVDNPYVASWLRAEQPGFDAVHAGDLDARAITSAALRYLTAAGRCPTVLFLHYLDTHTPYRAPARWARRFIDRHAATTIGLTFDDVTGAWQDRYDAPDRQRIVDLYDGNLAYADHEIGRLLRGLARRARLDRSLVVVSADHGEELWDHRKFFHGQSLYDELLHVPLLVRWPDVGHGRVVDALVRSVDLVPTIAEALRHTAAAADGRTLRPLAAGTADGADTSRTAFALVAYAEPRTPERQAVRTATHKLIRDVSDGALQVYDLTTDPKEKRNLGIAAPGAADLTRTLDGFRAPLVATGYHLRLRAPSDRTVHYRLELASEPPVPVIAIDRLSLEPDDFVDFGQRSSAFGVTGVLAPDDEDEVRFDVLAATGTLRLAVQLDGAPAPDGALRLGGTPAANGVVDLTDPRLDAPPAAAVRSNDVTVELWRASPLPSNRTTPALDDATRARLRQLGYVE